MPFKLPKRFQNNNPQSIREKYNQACRQWGQSHKAVGYFNSFTQEQRFLMLSLIADLTGASILDVGCGQADFWAFLNKEFQSLRYQGIDFSHEMIDISRSRFPEIVFQNGNFLDIEGLPEFDFVMASGIFNDPVQDQDEYVYSMLKKMHKLAKKGVAANFLSDLVPDAFIKDEALYYYTPVELVKLAERITPFFELKASYLPNDVTLYLF